MTGLHLRSRWRERTHRLPPPRTRNIVVQTDLRVPMRDGTELLADRWAPRHGADGLPVALIRGTVSRHDPFTATLVRPLAERGFQVVVQSSRGLYGSGGDFEPLVNERDDGLDTIDWVMGQPWFGGSIVLYGPSYQGYTQWTLADAAPDSVVAMVPAVSESALGTSLVPHRAFGLEALLGWAMLLDLMREPWATIRFLLRTRKRHRAERILPLSRAGEVALGRPSAMIDSFLENDLDSPRWEGIDGRHRVPLISVPTSVVTGWHDTFLVGAVRDFCQLQADGRDVRLTIGPWSHNSPELVTTTLHEMLDLARPLAEGAQPVPRAAVRLFVSGADEWRDLPVWPPDGYADRAYHLQPRGALGESAATASASATYIYDPADPTPALGGPRMLPGTASGSVDNRGRESRPDVLTYTSPPLQCGTELIGRGSATIWFESTRPCADLFLRVCDVDTSGVSRNVTDGFASVTSADTVQAVTIDLAPIAHRFRSGHRIRVQVSSGAFPLYNRNLGTGDPLPTAEHLVAATQTIRIGPEHRSHIILPLRDIPDAAAA